MAAKRSLWRVVVALVLVLAAAGLVWVGLPREEEAAPEPVPFVVSDSDPEPVVVDRSVHAAAGEVLIPSLSIRAPFSAGSVSGAELRIPSDPSKLTIYSAGSRPCSDEGTVLLAGHVVSYGVHGALWDLHQVKPNAVVYTGCQDGSTAVWKVVEVRVEQKDDLPQDLFSAEGDPRLVIVTCGGPIITRPDGRHYRDNVIVYASPIGK